MKLLITFLALVPLVGCKPEAKPQATMQPDDQGEIALRIPRAALVEPHLVASGQYDEAQLTKLPALGYHTVIQLRPATEGGSGWEEAKVRDLDLTFMRIPVEGAKDLTEANARKLDAALKESHGGTLVAGSSGNRVGGLFALRAFYCEKMSAEKALEVGRKAGLTDAEPEVRKVLGLPEAK